jgi:class 3 adenylate cyclase
MAPRISLGRLLDLARTRGALSRSILLRQTSAHDLAAAAGIATDGSEDRLLEKVREEARFRCDDAATAEAQGGLAEAERAAVQPFRDFARVDEIVRIGKASLEDAEREAHRLLDGRLVFVGWTATGAASDFVPTPLGARTPGVVAHAVAADMVLSARGYRSLAPFLSPLLAFAVGALATATTLLPALAAAGAGLGLLGGVAWVAVALLFAREHFVVPLVAPLASGIAAWVGATATRAALAQLDAQRITRQFKARVAPELVDYLVGHPDALSMAGEPREVTAFFLDLAGFTSVSERLGARDSVALLNRCMNAATVALTRHQAYVNKYLGDGLMAFWSAFRPDAEQAGRAAPRRARVMEELARDRRRADPARIGIATGRVIVGDRGAPPLLHDFTAIGDAINPRRASSRRTAVRHAHPRRRPHARTGRRAGAALPAAARRRRRPERRGRLTSSRPRHVRARDRAHRAAVAAGGGESGRAARASASCARVRTVEAVARHLDALGDPRRRPASALKAK